MVQLFGLNGRLLVPKGIDLVPTSELEEKLRKVPEGTKVGILFLDPADRPEISKLLELYTATNKFPQNYMASSGYFDKISQICSSCNHEVSWLDNKELWIKYFNALQGIENRRVPLTTRISLSEVDSLKIKDRKRTELEESVYGERVYLAKNHLMNLQRLLFEHSSSDSMKVFIGDTIHIDRLNFGSDTTSLFGTKCGQYSTDILVNPPQPVLTFKGYTNQDTQRIDGFDSLRKAINLVEKGSLYESKPDWIGTTTHTSPSSGYFELFIEKVIDGVTYGRIEEVSGTSRFRGIFGSEQIKFDQIGGNNQGDTFTTFKTDGGDSTRGIYRGVVNHNGVNDGMFYLETFDGRMPFEMYASWKDLLKKPKAQLELFR
ncbi:MAG: hypothetical protein KAQ83_04055 [Nanoarchaeota archaeon]|nr:hypothetical protein [Nanoarchaeota archaeon]